jgi:acetaldehyde dehydrogenase
MAKTKVAILGSGNIGTDLMLKILRESTTLELAAMVGVDPQSDGLARARSQCISVTTEGIDGFVRMREFADVELVFDATSAHAHARHDDLLRAAGKRLIDLTPAARGPLTVPVVNLDRHSDAPNVNMTTCGGQATIPIVAAISRVAPVHYAEIVASVSSRSAGPGTRANIDEFTRTTARGLEVVGGARRGKAIIILNPAEPPMMMRDSVFVLSDDTAVAQIEQSVREMVAAVQRYVPGYRLKQDLQFERFAPGRPLRIPGYGVFSGVRSSVYLEVAGAGHYLPAYAGNLDIMTAAALATGERLVQRSSGATA